MQATSGRAGTHLMAEPSTTPKDRLAIMVQALPLAHKVTIGAAVAVVALSAVMFFQWISSPSYSVLASGIDSEELANITTELDRLSVDYQVEAAGTRVTVARSQLGTAMAGLGAAGIATNENPDRIGYELLDNQGLAVSSNLERINVQRALEGELGRTLRDFDRITAATVHLVVPDTGLFGDPNAAEASVVLDVPTDFTLGETDAVAALIAGSVENLAIDDVTIVDLQGRTLRVAADGTDATTANGRDVLRTIEFEQRLESDITRLLLTTGAGDRATVMVRAELNFDRSESRTETFDNTSQIAIRESSSNETFTGPGSEAPGGIAGVDGDTADTADGEGAIDYSKIDTATEYGVSNVVTSTINAPGDVESIHIGVVVDDGSITGAAVPEAAVLEALISAGIGLRPERGDTLSVTATPFPEVSESANGSSLLDTVAEPAAASPLALIPQAVGGLAIVIAAVGLLLMSRRKKLSAADDGDVDLRDEAAALLAGPTAGGALDPGSAGELPRGVGTTEETAGQTGVRGDVIDLVQRQPEDMAALLRGWLAEG